MTGDRVTALFNIDGGEWLYDKWTDARTWQRAGPWKGFTFLKLKTAEVASTTSVGAASSGARSEDRSNQEQEESSSDGSYSVVTTERGEC